LHCAIGDCSIRKYLVFVVARDGWEAKALLGYYEAKERAKYRRDREPLMIPPRRLPPPPPASYASTRRSPKRRRYVECNI